MVTPNQALSLTSAATVRPFRKSRPKHLPLLKGNAG